MAWQFSSHSASTGPEPLAASPVGALADALSHLATWFGVALAHAMGRATGPEPVAPPLLGVQPYRDIPRRRRR